MAWFPEVKPAYQAVFEREQSGWEGQGNVHRARDLGKLMNLAKMYLGWEEDLCGDLPRGTSRKGNAGLVGQH